MPISIFISISISTFIPISIPISISVSVSVMSFTPFPLTTPFSMPFPRLRHEPRLPRPRLHKAHQQTLTLPIIAHVPASLAYHPSQLTEYTAHPLVRELILD
jgi:hypothetical protein